ncbi:MAG TPA: sigma factor-like helix-turn-helix DNA-binding protein [Kofleriaceae bacterium]
MIDGEDIVQDTLAKALYALSLSPDVPPLRPWLFRIAHNAALDHLKRHGHKLTDARDDLDEVIGADDRADPAVMRAALSRFVALPIAQRSAVILKDVLGHSLDDTAEIMATTVPAVKAALARGRARLIAEPDEADAPKVMPRGELDRYVALFNARDWDGVRALVGEDCRLDLVSKSQRRGKAVGAYFARYEREAVRLAAIRLEGEPALAVFVGDATTPAYFILTRWTGGRLAEIRDFRYVPYMVGDADYTMI